MPSLQFLCKIYYFSLLPKSKGTCKHYRALLEYSPALTSNLYNCIGISYFLYYLTQITSATVISVCISTLWGSKDGTVVRVLASQKMWLRFKSWHWRHMWVDFCCWFSLLQEVLLWVLLWFSPLLKNQHFQIPIQPGMADKEPKCGCWWD